MPSKSSQRPVVAELEVQNPLHLPFKHVSQTGEPDGLPRSAPLQSIPLATDTPIPAPGVHAFSTPKTLPALGVPILYEDAWLIVVDKPSGLLSVPGRYLTTQDSVLSRLRFTLPAAAELRSVHRLDQDTSGVLIQARDLETYRRLSRQFQGGQVQKRYEAILEKPPEVAAGHIDLPLTADLSDRPRQRVDRQQGKPSVTRFRVLAQERLGSRVEFLPLTGRTHQLRVHAADPAGLNSPILGDRLYGRQPHLRLHLHAESLVFQHPHTGQEMCLTAPVPF